MGYSNVGGAAQFSVADSGVLAYLSFANPDMLSSDGGAVLSWMNRAGAKTAMRSSPLPWIAPQFSPEGDRIALLTTNEAILHEVWGMTGVAIRFHD